jgi:hypothetical protein
MTKRITLAGLCLTLAAIGNAQNIIVSRFPPLYQPHLTACFPPAKSSGTGLNRRTPGR